MANFTAIPLLAAASGPAVRSLMIAAVITLSIFLTGCGVGSAIPQGTADVTLKLQGMAADFDKCSATLLKKKDGPELSINFFKTSNGPSLSLNLAVKPGVESLDPSALRSFSIKTQDLSDNDQAITKMDPRSEIRSLSGRLAAEKKVKGRLVHEGYDLAFETVIPTRLQIARHNIPLALTGIVIVFTVLSLLALTIKILPKIVDLTEPWLPQGHGHHGHGGHGGASKGAAAAAAAGVAAVAGAGSVMAGTPFGTDAAEDQRVAAAIAAVMHKQRQGQ